MTNHSKNAVADSSSIFSSSSQFKVSWSCSASSSGLAVVGSGLWVGFRSVSWVFVPLSQRLPGDVVFMAKEWQVYQSPAKSCHRFQVSTCVASITSHCQSKWCGQVQSQWDRVRHSAYSGRGGEWLVFGQYSSLSQSVRKQGCAVSGSHKGRSAHFSLGRGSASLRRWTLGWVWKSEQVL